jgi:hypothetical protein
MAMAMLQYDQFKSNHPCHCQSTRTLGPVLPVAPVWKGCSLLVTTSSLAGSHRKFFRHVPHTNINRGSTVPDLFVQRTLDEKNQSGTGPCRHLLVTKSTEYTVRTGFTTRLLFELLNGSGKARKSCVPS